jgi:hypothetical protein
MRRNRVQVMLYIAINSPSPGPASPKIRSSYLG